MAIEIEHKYLIKHELWKLVVPEKTVIIKQAYLSTDPIKTIRVRIKDKKGFITIKGKAEGASRQEFEYEIPYEDASELIEGHSTNIIEKKRHIVTYEGHIWEIDEFLGLNRGLIIAEIELQSVNEKYQVPGWVDKNITLDYKYTNANLSLKPYSTW